MDNSRIERCLERALYEHERCVMEPPRGYHVTREGEIVRKRKSDFVNASSHQTEKHTSKHIIKYIEEGLQWKLEQPYTNSAKLSVGGFSWCGAFAGWCDIELNEQLRKKVMPSTYRLYEFCMGTEREIPLDEIQRGDIVVVGKLGGKRWGAHITRVLAVHDEYVLAIEGNAHGVLGNGQWGEGVITRKRPFKEFANDGESHIMFAYRFLDSDYDEV